MAIAQDAPLLGYLRHFAGVRADPPLADTELLRRFAAERDETAFASLVRRHGPMVLGVCRRVLGDWHTAEDAFQAVFLVLARKAGGLRRPEALAPWLYGVAIRVARKARVLRARRDAGERRRAVSEATHDNNDLVWSDLRPLLDEAIGGLAESYRVPFVLCYVQGKTVSEAACQLGWPRGTVATRLTRAREQLRRRLVRRGVALTAAGLGALLLEGTASARVPARLLVGTVHVAAMPGLARPEVAALAQGGWNPMYWTRTKLAALVLVALGALGVSLGASAFPTGGSGDARDKEKAPRPVAPPRAALPAPDVVKEIEIHVRVYEGDPNGSREEGTLKIVSAPRIMALDNQMAYVHIGGESAIENGRGEVESVPFGWRFQICPKLRKDGKVWLDVQVDHMTPPETSGERVENTSRSVHVRGPARAHEAFKVVCEKEPADRQVWVELSVESIKEISTRDVTPPR